MKADFHVKVDMSIFTFFLCPLSHFCESGPVKVDITLFLEIDLVRFVLVYSKKLFLIIFCISRHDGQISKKILKLAYLKEFCADNDGTLRFGVAPPESTLAGAEIDAGDKFVSGLPFLTICSTPTTTSVCQ